MVSGLIGASLITRDCAQLRQYHAGGQTRLSCFFHGILLLPARCFSRNTNAIPLACLAAILLKLA
jgi:MFS superfamily sulfate permease-like transporter